MKKLTKQEFIEKSKKIHGNKYNYDDIEYIKSSTIVKNIYCNRCKKYFDQIGTSHILGFGCKFCAKENLWKTKRHKMTHEEFIDEAKKIHGNKYDYSLVEYKDKRTNVKIKCNKCGNIFEQSPFIHLKGQGCNYCKYEVISQKLSLGTDKFIEKANKVHNNKYDYSKVEYINNNTKVCIICPEHGEFWQTPQNHLNKQGCPLCNTVKNVKYTTKEFKHKMYEIFGNKYDFSKTEYVNRSEEVDVYCHKHGWFKKKPSSLLHGFGCPKCGKESRSSIRSLTNEEFIKKAKLIHGEKYDYSETKYIKSNQDVTIKCPIHGNFNMTANSHLSGSGCSKCAIEKRSDLNRLTKEEFIEKARKIHGNEYDYTDSIYINYNTDLKVICKKHKTHFLITPHEHLGGVGCPKCNRSHMERELSIFLEENNIHFIEQYRENLNGQSLDFYLPYYNIAIECQGLQHFKPVYFGKNKNKIDYDILNDDFVNTTECDFKKYKKCNDLNIKIMYYTTSKIYKQIIFNNLKYISIYKNNIYIDKQKLLNKIKGEM